MSYAPIHSEINITTEQGLKPETISITTSPTSNTQSRSKTRNRRPTKQSKEAAKFFRKDYPIIVHSHLCWDWVWQRPQQFLSRLSERHKILFVETVGPDPELAAPLARFRRAPNFPNVTLLRLQFPAWRWPDGEYVDAERRRLVQEFLKGPVAGQFDYPVQWFYDPMAVTAFVGKMGEVGTVYDCMDELSKFRGAPPHIVEREAELLRCADVVFTGGRKLYESKSRLHRNCHFYGCGVDWQHFGKAREQITEVPTDVVSLPRPLLGYFGVVDERMDYELVARVADAFSGGSVVIVGPAIKVDVKTFPKRPNLHWIGGRAYEQLPAYCKGFDLCLMPFALNEATEYINPTKALEYMATGRPIISTGVADVVRNFGEVVKIGHSPDEFVALCRESLDRPDKDATARGLEMARANSWDSIVNRLENHVEEALLSKHPKKGAA